VQDNFLINIGKLGDESPFIVIKEDFPRKLLVKRSIIAKVTSARLKLQNQMFLIR